MGRWAREAAEAALAVCGTVVATHPGMDEGRDEVLAALTDLAVTEPRLRLVAALGRDYPAVLAAADVVVGNSSSGVIEAATVHVPAVDVGERQRGRLRGDNVVHADEGRAPVEAALRTALSPQWRDRTAATVNPTARVGPASASSLSFGEHPAAPHQALRRPAAPRRGRRPDPGARGGAVTERDLRAACAPTTASIRDALEVVDRSATAVCLLIDDTVRLAGLLTDGDLRRAFLKGSALDDAAIDHATRSPHFVAAGSPRALVLDLMQALRISVVPELDTDRTLVGLHTLSDVVGVGPAAQRRRHHGRWSRHAAR